MPRAIAQMAPAALGFCADPVHAPVHAETLTGGQHDYPTFCMPS
jgi:hypothetical protein